MNTNTNTPKSIRTDFIEWISKSPNKYHLTITYIRGTSDIEAASTFQAFINFLNKKVFCNRYWKKHNSHLKGIVARERSTNGTLHYHIIFTDSENDLPGTHEFDENVRGCITKLKSKHNKNRLLTEEGGWKLQDYSNNGDNDLETYVTKNFECTKMTADEAFNSIGLLGVDGVTFGGAARKHAYYY